MASAQAQKRARAIAALKDKRGRITPAAVVEAARDPKHILHEEFEWSDAKAAELHRLSVAARLIREVKFIVESESVSLIAPVFISDPDTDESSYVETSVVARQPAKARRVLIEELSRIKAATHRATTLAAVFGLVAYFERMLETALEAEHALHEAGDDEADHASA